MDVVTPPVLVEAKALVSLEVQSPGEYGEDREEPSPASRSVGLTSLDARHNPRLVVELTSAHQNRTALH